MSVMLRAADIKASLPPRSSTAHKGSNGHVLLVVGSRGLSGAGILSALGALRAGAGLVTVAIVESERGAIIAHLPEAMTLPLPEASDGSMSSRAFGVIELFLRRRVVTTLGVGPGLSTKAGPVSVVHKLLRKKIPTVLDADGLNAVRPNALKGHPALVITPHPGELGTLLKKPTAVIQKDRSGIARQTARDLGLVCVLKGHHTVVSNGRQDCINPTGNSAMATGGMGDVLTGIVAGLLAQGLSPWDAACAGVYCHGLAADLAKISDRGLLATEVAHAVPRAFRKIGV